MVTSARLRLGRPKTGHVHHLLVPLTRVKMAGVALLTLFLSELARFWLVYGHRTPAQSPHYTRPIRNVWLRVVTICLLQRKNILTNYIYTIKPRPHHQHQCRSNIVEATGNIVEAPSTLTTMSNATNWTILSIMSNVASTLLPFSATMSNEISFFRQSRNKLNVTARSEWQQRTLRDRVLHWREIS